MRHIVVLGGFGFFGSAVIRSLRAAGLSPLIGSRRSTADLTIDVEDLASIHETLRPGDVVVDVVGPYQQRTTRLIESAIEVGFDVVDLADSLSYVRSVYALEQRIDAAKIRVVTACSAMSSISAAMIRLSELTNPVRLTGFLVPATRETAVAGTAASLFCSVGKPIQVFRDAALVTQEGWRSKRSFTMPSPVGTRTGYLFESADSFTLPPIWPSLHTVEFFVDSNVRGLNMGFALATRFPALRRLMDHLQKPGLRLSRLLGRECGGLGYEIESVTGEVVRLAVTAQRRGYITAIAPAVLVTQQLAEERTDRRGLLTPDQHLDPRELVQYLERHIIAFSVMR